MKKLIITSVIFFTFLFGVMQVNASSVMSTNQESNGSISATLTFKEGYVGGIHAVIEINGNVEIESIEWNSSLTNNYTKRYYYENNILTILITTGDAAKNLLDKNRNLNIGIIHFKTTSNDTQDYSLKLNQITIVDAEYKSISLDVSTKEETYTISDTSKEDSSNNSTPNQPQDTNTSESNLENNLESNTTNINNIDSFKENDIDENDETENEDVISNNDIDSKQPEKVNFSNETTKLNTQKKKLNYFFVGLAIAVGFCLIISVIIVRRKKLKKY